MQMLIYMRITLVIYIYNTVHIIISWDILHGCPASVSHRKVAGREEVNGPESRFREDLYRFVR